MIPHQDLTDEKTSIIVGAYKRIVVTVYTDDKKTDVDTNLAGAYIEWLLIGAKGTVIMKTTDEGIVVDDPDPGDITIEILEADSEGLSPGYYTHIAELTSSGRKRPLFDGEVVVKNN